MYFLQNSSFLFFVSLSLLAPTLIFSQNRDLNKKKHPVLILLQNIALPLSGFFKFIKKETTYITKSDKTLDNTKIEDAHDFWKYILKFLHIQNLCSYRYENK